MLSRLFARLGTGKARWPGTGERAIVLDCETTSLDVTQARLLSVAALPLIDRRLQLHQLKLWRVQAQIGTEDNAPIHGLRSADLADGDDLGTVLTELREFIRGAPIIGYHIGYDLTVLQHNAAAGGVAWPKPIGLELSDLVPTVGDSNDRLSLDELGRCLGVELPGAARHTADGDVFLTACLYLQLRFGDVSALQH